MARPRKTEYDREDAYVEAKEIEAERNADPDKAIREAVAAARGRPTVRKRPEAPVKEGENPEFVARLRELSMEKARHLKAAADFATGRISAMPVTSISRFRRADPTVTPRREDGTPYGSPATRKKWVPHRTDMHGRPTEDSYAVTQHISDGYSIVRDDDGKPIESTFGVLMEIGQLEAAERVIALTPGNAVRPEDFLAAEVESFAEETNRRARTTAMNVWREKSHKTHINDQEPTDFESIPNYE